MADHQLSSQTPAYFGGRVHYRPSLQSPPSLSYGALIRNGGGGEYGRFLSQRASIPSSPTEKDGSSYLSWPPPPVAVAAEHKHQCIKEAAYLPGHHLAPPYILGGDGREGRADVRPHLPPKSNTGAYTPPPPTPS